MCPALVERQHRLAGHTERTRTDGSMPSPTHLPTHPPTLPTQFHSIDPSSPEQTSRNLSFSCNLTPCSDLLENGKQKTCREAE